jgi:hypothetical protein
VILSGPQWEQFMQRVGKNSDFNYNFTSRKKKLKLKLMRDSDLRVSPIAIMVFVDISIM